MQAASPSRAGNRMLMNVLLSLWLVAASVHCGVTTGFVAITSDSILPLQVRVDESGFCWLFMRICEPV